ncbi:MAG: flagellar biosynthetic protein FliR [Pseudomonadota bacterium]
MTAIATLLGTWQGILVDGAFVFLRIGALMALLPAFGERTVPARVRLVLAILFTVVVTPLSDGVRAPVDPALYLARGGIEIVVGLALGLALRLIFLSLQMAGTIAANVVSLSQILGGVSVDPQPAMGHILAVAGLALAVIHGLHLKAIHALVESYAVFPGNVAPPAAALAEWGTARVAQSFALAFSLSAPFVIASVIYNLALGAINRAMPQLMVAFVGAPAITMGGLVLLFLCGPMILSVWLAAFDAVLADPFGTR